MKRKKIMVTFLAFLCLSVMISTVSGESYSESPKKNIHRGRVYFFISNENEKACFDCHTVSGIKKNDCPVIIDKATDLETIADHLDETLDYLEKEEKDSLISYLKRLFTKNIEDDSKIFSKKKAVMDKALRDRLLSLGYISSSDNAYSEPVVELKKTAEFSSIELLKYSSLGFERFRDPLSDIGFSLKSEIRFESAIVLPVVELQPENYNLTISYCNSVSDSKVSIQTYQYFSGIEIEKKSFDLEKSNKVGRKSIVFSGRSEKIIVVLRFYTDDNLRIMGIKIRKS